MTVQFASVCFPTSGLIQKIEEYIDLSENTIEGGLITEIGNMENLKSLVLASNFLSGFLPTEIGRLSNLGEADEQLAGLIQLQLI